MKDIKIYNQLLSNRDSEFRLKRNGEALTLITTSKILIKRNVDEGTLDIFIKMLLEDEFGVPATVNDRPRQSGSSSSSSSSSSSDGGLLTGVLLGSILF